MDKYELGMRYCTLKPPTTRMRLRTLHVETRMRQPSRLHRRASRVGAESASPPSGTASSANACRAAIPARCTRRRRAESGSAEAGTVGYPGPTFAHRAKDAAVARAGPPEGTSRLEGSDRLPHQDVLDPATSAVDLPVSRFGMTRVDGAVEADAGEGATGAPKLHEDEAALVEETVVREARRRLPHREPTRLHLVRLPHGDLAWPRGRLRRQRRCAARLLRLRWRRPLYRQPQDTHWELRALRLQ